MVYSETLEETIFFCRDDTTKTALCEAGAEAWSIYTKDELRVLVRQNRVAPLSTDELLKVHEIKKTFRAAPHKKQPSADPHHNVAVESEPAGAVIEVNGDYRGRTPCVISVVGTSAGTVPWPGLTVKAIPTRPGDFVQINSFTSGGDLPKRLYFNMALVPAAQETDVQIQ